MLFSSLQILNPLLVIVSITYLSKLFQLPLTYLFAIMSTEFSQTLTKDAKDSKVGVTFKNNDEGSLFVESVVEGGLAASSGLKAGDIVSEMNGESMEKKASWLAAKLVREAEGEIVVKGLREVSEEELASAADLSSPKDEELEETAQEKSGMCGMFC